MSYRRSGEYIVKVSAWEQFKSAIWALVFGAMAFALTEGRSLLVVMLGWLLAVWMLFVAWRFVAVGFQIMGAEGDVMTRKRR